MPTAVVTGGGGFIGSHLCEALLERDWSVICIDNFLTGRWENITHFEENPCFKLSESDVSNSIEVDGDVDYVLHLASPASPIGYQKLPLETLKVGAFGTYNALGLARAKGAKFLFTSTSEVYGDPLVNPQPESYWGNVNPIGPRSVYDEAKRFAEALTLAYHRVHKLDVKIARIFNTYGPRMCKGDGRVVPAFIVQALAGKPLTVFGDGCQTRSFCFISDMVEGLCKLMDADLNTPVNLGNSHEVTILKLAETILKLTGSKSKIGHKPLPVDDPRVRRPDIGKAEQELNWQPKVDLEAGLRETIDWFINQ